jgi:ankyrin repeat protein
MGLLMSTVQLRPVRALSFGWRWLQSEPNSFIAGDYFVKNATSGFQPQAGLAYVQKPTPFSARFTDCPANFKAIMQNAESIPAAILKGPPPSVASKAMIHDDLMYRIEIIGNDTIHRSLESMIAADALVYKVGKYPVVLPFGPAVRDLEVSFVMAVRDSKDAIPNSVRMAGFSMANPDTAHKSFMAPNIEGVLGIMIKMPSTLMVVADSAAYEVNLKTIDPSFNFSTAHHYRLIAHKGRAEVLVDSMRVYYAPISLPSRDLPCFFKADGVDCTWAAVSVVELVDPNDKNTVTMRDINKREAGGQTRLIRSIYRNYYDDVPLLVQHGADIFAKDDLQRSALDWAAWRDSKATADYLISKGAKADFFTYASLGETDKVREMLKADPTLAAKALPCGWTAYLGAVSNDHVETAKLLIQYAIDPNARDPEGLTPLMWAAKNRSKAMMELVLTTKPTIDLTDKFGRSAMFLVRDSAELSGLLKARGANEAATPPNGDF